MVRVAAALAVLLASSIGASAQEPAPKKDAQGGRMKAAFKSWAAQWGVQNASFAVMRDDDVVGLAKVGDGDPKAPRPVASLSKAITGVCVAELVESKKLSYGANLGKLLKAYFKKRPPADPAAKSITVGQLLNHAAGLTYDPTQGTAEFAALDFKKPDLTSVTAMALNRPLGAKTYVYNNANYAALGLVIESVTGKSYEKACSKLVLTPAGVKKAGFDPNWRIMASWGGWNISAVDYAKFLDHFRPGSKLLKSPPSSWPQVGLEGGAFYSIGTYQRISRDGVTYNFWHSGAWRWSAASIPERNVNYGAYFVVMFQNLRYVANYAPQPPSAAIGDLDNVMWAAAYPARFSTKPAAPSAAAPASEANGSDRGVEDIEIDRARQR
ncbi:serine hydrolase domain-containing protein [Chenggangzhangella methanolivorans]|uniref:Beta-lactamase family protein n=1 Tax=Chenggangzhangella methanolivorans TaxID=1437009 RepID=A0A9E6RAV5_9HYPH|nr:serine hydrolase domain-containing protein [Chenggangzhangella methanolivorans]QZO00807.1 beta-lactamase family protein [Chenggangzhangella methanolivorans]